MILNLTNEEIDVLLTYLMNKTMRLEESDLKDSRCYVAMTSIIYKIYRGKKNEK